VYIIEKWDDNIITDYQDCEHFDTIEEARTWITDIIQDDNELHPDAESCYITQVVEEIRVVESLEISDYHEVKFVPYE
jgi:hypothetical protein